MDLEKSEIIEEISLEENSPENGNDQTYNNDQTQFQKLSTPENVVAESTDSVADDQSMNLDGDKKLVDGDKKLVDGDKVDVVPKRGRPRKNRVFPNLHVKSPKDMNENDESIQDKSFQESKIIEENNAIVGEVSIGSVENTPDTPANSTPRRYGRRKKIYDDDDGDADPATRKEKQKKRAIEYKLQKLKSSFNIPDTPVSGKRQKRAPQRFELTLPEVKRRSLSDDQEGSGQHINDIGWILQELRTAHADTLRSLHRIMYYRKGLFTDKVVMKNILKFNGFPFSNSDPEFTRRRGIIQKLTTNNLKQISQCLCLKHGEHEEMVDRILNFLLRPSIDIVNTYMQEKALANKQAALARQQQLSTYQKAPENVYHEDDDPSLFPLFNSPLSKVDLSAQWKKPGFFVEGNGVKLKYIRAVIANIEAASDAFVELLHRLLYLNVDERSNMRRNILEFSGLNCDIGTPNYVYRVRILSVLPMEQLKLICRVLCLPTWHKSRPFLTDSIMDFLSVPRISAMKKRVPPVFSEEISFSFDRAKTNKVQLPELKTDEMVEIEIVPDIHMPDENISHLGTDYHVENEYLGVKLKNFSNIHYQVISTHTSKLADLHRILYLTSAPAHNTRKNILEFSGFAFDDNSTEYLCRRTLMEQYNLEALKRVASVLCVSQYICDDSKKSLIDAILKFLLKPSALLSSSTIMPTISQNPLIQSTPPVRKVATSTSGGQVGPISISPEIVVSKSKMVTQSKDTSMRAIIEAIQESETKIELEKVKACLSNSAIEITPVPVVPEVRESSRRKAARPSKIVQEPESILPDKPRRKRISTEVVAEVHKPPPNIKKEAPTVSPPIQYLSSDDEDDKPLSKMVGHPNDDHLKALVSKIIKESRLEDITMKHVIKKVFAAYPNYDLNYRKEFIKSNVRSVLSQMDDQNCSVSTTVINI